MLKYSIGKQEDKQISCAPEDGGIQDLNKYYEYIRDKLCP